MDRNELARRIYERSHVMGRFRLRSGTTTDHYFDKYAFESDPALLARIAEALEGLLPESYDALAGIELGGIPLAVALSQRTGRPAFFVRKEEKTYGTQRLAEGGDVEGRRLVLLEDVITSGGQILASCKALRALGAEIVRVVVVIDRESGGAENLGERGVELRALFRASELQEAGDGDTGRDQT